MCRLQILVALALSLVLTGVTACQGMVEGEASAISDALVIRLIHPDRQAITILDLFNGARPAHPAAALAAWKRSARDPNLLGKPLEAVIAMFNPEMAREWKSLHDAELRIDFAASDGRPGWYAVVPQDDGTLAAGITAMRLTDGATEEPVLMAGRKLAVERLGPAGSALATRSDDMLIIGSSCDELLRGVRRVATASGKVPKNDVLASGPKSSASSSVENRIDSGLVFEFVPEQLKVSAGPIMLRRIAVFSHGIGSRRSVGNLALKGDRLALQVETSFARAGGPKISPTGKQTAIDRSWLAWVPKRDAIAVISVAIEPGAAFWDSAFALADRIEQADPSRADVAPLRTRLNLLATAVGARPEVDLWPHLKGITACATAPPDRPGRPDRGLLVLHTDSEASAERLAVHVLPRLIGLLTGRKPPGEPVRKAPQTRTGGAPLSQVPIDLGAAGGRPLLLIWRGRDVVIGWGEHALSAAIDAAASPDRSAAGLCADWKRDGKDAPQRLGAFWPARCLPTSRGVDTASPAWKVLAQNPPAVWWGWNAAGSAQDLIQLPGLRDRVRQFIETLELNPVPLP